MARRIDIDVDDILDRFKNGNQFEPETKAEIGEVYNNLNVKNPHAANGNTGVSLAHLRAQDDNIAAKIDVLNANAEMDGVGVNVSVTGASASGTVGPLDIGANLGRGELGFKVWDSNGLDSEFKCNASAADVQVRPLSATIGVGIDSNLKVGLDGVGVKWLGTGIQIGRRT